MSDASNIKDFVTLRATKAVETIAKPIQDRRAQEAIIRIREIRAQNPDIDQRVQDYLTGKLEGPETVDPSRKTHPSPMTYIGDFLTTDNFESTLQDLAQSWYQIETRNFNNQGIKPEQGYVSL